VNPALGPAAGTTRITITGNNLTSPVGLTAVTVGGKVATGVNCATATQCTAAVPAGIGTGDVLVSVAGQTSAANSADQYTYVAAPVVTGVSPSAGPAAGGTPITITGTDLTSALGSTGITVGGRTATSVACTSSTQCTALTPAGVGTQDVVVAAGSQRSASGVADRFTLVSAPSITAIAPRSGPPAGGTTVTITGSNLTSVLGATTISIGGMAVSSASCASSTQCSVVTPAGTGTVDVAVSAGSQTSPAVTADKFTY
jgi:hypothetical protein